MADNATMWAGWVTDMTARCRPFRSGASCPAWGLFVLILATGCSTGTNDDLIATTTPYPVRSPVVTPGAERGTPASPVAAAIATGQAAQRTGIGEQAIATFESSLAADASNIAALAGRAAARMEAGDLSGAGADADAALAAAPDRVDLHLLRADIAARRADFGAADEGYRRAVALDPASSEAFLGRGTVARIIAQGDSGHYQAALDHYTRALVLDTGSAAARIGRAEVFLDRWTFRGDVADLDRALAELDALPPGAQGATVAPMRARVLAASGDIDGARRTLDAPTIRRLDEPATPLAARETARATVAFAARDWDAAADVARVAVAVDPAAWEAHHVLADAELRRGNMAAALAAADAVLSRWSDDGPSLYVRAAALRELGRDGEAQEAFNLADRRLAASPVYRARIAQTLGDG